MKTWPLLNNSSRNGYVLGSGGIVPPFLTSALDEVSGQLHASAALLPGKEHLVSIGWDFGWAPEQVWKRWRRKICQTPSGN